MFTLDADEFANKLFCVFANKLEWSFECLTLWKRALVFIFGKRDINFRWASSKVLKNKGLMKMNKSIFRFP